MCRGSRPLLLLLLNGYGYGYGYGVPPEPENQNRPQATDVIACGQPPCGLGWVGVGAGCRPRTKHYVGQADWRLVYEQRREPELSR